MLTVACVLRSGGDYAPDYVIRLRNMVRRHIAREHSFVCLSDLDIPEVDVRPLVHDWPGWWSKIELFRPGLFEGQVLYLDLDTVLVDGIDDIAGYRGELCMLSGFGRGQPASGMMSWQAGLWSAIYEAFRADPQEHMARLRVGSRNAPGHVGDQGFIAETVGTGMDRWQSLAPGIVGKRAVRENGYRLPNGTRVVCWSGKPRLHNLEADWLRRHWI